MGKRISRLGWPEKFPCGKAQGALEETSMEKSLVGVGWEAQQEVTKRNKV